MILTQLLQTEASEAEVHAGLRQGVLGFWEDGGGLWRYHLLPLLGHQTPRLLASNFKFSESSLAPSSR